MSTRAESPSGPPSSPRGGPVAWLLRLFSSIRLGITLLTCLFVYSSIGSAGILIPTAGGVVHRYPRQWRGLEMTEFEFFHWWPFKLLIALICVNLVVATVRRIPFKPVNYGVWMIHSGIIVLALGSVLYFSTKVEGDSPVVRRHLVVEVPGAEPVSIPAVPGNRTEVGRGPDGYSIAIRSIDPSWELLTGEHAGERAFSVTVAVESPTQSFMRQLIAGYPELTEDLVRSDDPRQPFARARKELGRPIVDETLKLSLAHEPQPYVYLANNIAKAWAIYLREQGDREWIQRPVRGLPLYNDYITDTDEVWMATGDPPLEPDPLRVPVPPRDGGDPLADVDLTITSYLRYAFLEQRLQPGGAELNPTLSVRLANDQGFARTYELAAFDPGASTGEGGRLQFVWVDSPEARAALAEFRERMLSISVPGTEIAFEVPIVDLSVVDPELPFSPIEGTDYAYRVQSVQDDLVVGDRLFSLAMVEIRRGEESFLRWVFEDPNLTRDRPLGDAAAAHPDALPLDTGIVMGYDRGHRAAPVLVVAGPAPDDLGVQLTLPGRTPVFHPVAVGETLPVDQGITLSVLRYDPHTARVTRPAVVPSARRDRDAGEQFSMVRVTLPPGSTPEQLWVPYHHYPVTDRNEELRRFTYRPAEARLPDGRGIQLILSRQRRPLPSPVVLEAFRLRSHVGGFTGRTSSIRDYVSVIRFETPSGLTEPDVVSMNKPTEHGGFWYFQSQWDPPMGPRFDGDVPSAGLNYTVLGVGNRHGVMVQLAGCIIAVLGMIYAFYIKPVIKRRRRHAVHARLPGPVREPVLATAGQAGPGAEEEQVVP